MHAAQVVMKWQATTRAFSVPIRDSIGYSLRRIGGERVG
jgi:hypothetical protein